MEPIYRGRGMSSQQQRIEAGKAIADYLDGVRKGKSVLFVPIVSGRKEDAMYADAVEMGMADLGVPYRSLPARVSRPRRKVLRPTVEEVGDNVKGLRQDTGSDVIAVGYDDTVTGGIRLLSLYGFLKDYKAANIEDRDHYIDDVLITAFSDLPGVTDFSYMPPEFRVDKDEALENLMSRREGVITSLVNGAVRRFVTTRRPKSEDIFRAAFML